MILRTVKSCVCHQKMLFLCFRFLYICVPLCGEGKCEEAVEDLPLLRQNEASRELRLKTFNLPFIYELTHLSTWLPIFPIPLNMDIYFRCMTMLIN